MWACVLLSPWEPRRASLTKERTILRDDKGRRGGTFILTRDIVKKKWILFI
jgi:hypothetical protein